MSTSQDTHQKESKPRHCSEALSLRYAERYPYKPISRLPVRIPEEVAAWRSWLMSFEYTHAISLTYNQRYLAAADACLRVFDETHSKQIWVDSGSRRKPNEPVSRERLGRDLDHFIMRVDRKMLGTRYSKLPALLRSSYLGVIEDFAINPHVHLLWRLPVSRASETEKLSEFARAAWGEITSWRGSACVKAAWNMAGWANYCLKKAKGENAVDRFVIGGAPLN